MRLRSCMLLAGTRAVLAAPSRAGAAQPALTLQGGWLNLEADWQTRSGLFFDGGVPLAGFFLAATTSGTSWAVPLELELGDQRPLDERFRLRLGVRSAFSVSGEDASGTGCSETVLRSFQRLELGLRYESAGAFVAGVVLPLLTMKVSRERGWHTDPWWPGPSLAFSQLYVGYRWGL